MLHDEGDFGRNGVVWEMKDVSFVGFEMAGHGFLRQEGFEAGGEKHPQFVIEADESLIESGIMEAIEADAVADVEAFRFMVAPGENMGGDEKFADGQGCDAAAVVVIVCE